MMYIVALIGALLGGMNFPATTIAVSGLTSLQAVAGRWGIAGIVFIVLACSGIVKVNYRGKKVQKVLLLALVQPCIYSICEASSIALTSTLLSSIFFATVPIFVAIFSIFVLHRRTNAKVVLGIVSCFAGVVACLAAGGGLSLKGNIGGAISIVGMVVCLTAFTLLSGKVQEEFTAMEVACAQSVLGGIWFNVLAFVESGGTIWYGEILESSSVLISLVYMGVLGTCLYYVLYNMSVKGLPVTQASVIQINITSLTGILSGIFIFHDAAGMNTVIGVILVLVGVVAVNIFSEDEKIHETGNQRENRNSC